MAPGPLGAPEGLRVGPTGRDEAQHGAGGAAEELRTEGRLCMGCPPRAPPYSWPGPVTPGASGALPAPPLPPGFSNVSVLGAQAAGAKGPPDWDI